jgi:hypothetical protein
MANVMLKLRDGGKLSALELIAIGVAREPHVRRRRIWFSVSKRAAIRGWAQIATSVDAVDSLSRQGDDTRPRLEMMEGISPSRSNA